MLNKYLEVPNIETVATFCIKNGEKRLIKKNEFFIKQNEPCYTLGYIAKGGFRYKVLNSSNIEYIVAYTFSNDYVSDYPALQTGSLTMFAAQAICDTEIYVISNIQLNTFFRKNKDLRARIAEVFLADIYAKLIMMHSESPEERYKRLINKYPHILNQVALKEIASYINVTPETLSRIRRKLVSNNN